MHICKYILEFYIYKYIYAQHAHSLLPENVLVHFHKKQICS